MLNYYTLLLDPKLKSNIDFDSPTNQDRSAEELIRGLRASYQKMDSSFHQENEIKKEKDDTKECSNLMPSCCML